MGYFNCMFVLSFGYFENVMTIDGSLATVNRRDL